MLDILKYTWFLLKYLLDVKSEQVTPWSSKFKLKLLIRLVLTGACIVIAIVSSMKSISLATDVIAMRKERSEQEILLTDYRNKLHRCEVMEEAFKIVCKGEAASIPGIGKK